jgi:hypothetical protein
MTVSWSGWWFMGRSKRDGVPIEQLNAFVVTVRDGKVVRTETYSSSREAVEADQTVSTATGRRHRDRLPPSPLLPRQGWRTDASSPHAWAEPPGGADCGARPARPRCRTK